MIGHEERNKQRLLHILKACEKILNYVEGLSREDFLNNPQTIDAVIYQLIVAGEAVIHLDKDLLYKYDYPWFKVRAFRNYAAHEYFNIEVWTVWGIVDKDVELLKSTVETILQKEYDQ